MQQYDCMKLYKLYSIEVRKNLYGEFVDLQCLVYKVNPPKYQFFLTFNVKKTYNFICSCCSIEVIYLVDTNFFN